MIPERQEKAPSICAHCGLPVPEPRQRADASDYFCCNGCEAIYQAIHQHGLSHFYQLRAKDSVDQFKPARYSGADFSYFDDATFVEQYTQETSAGSTCVTLYLEGVHCSACVWLIEKLPELLSGVCSARLDFARAELMLEYQSEQVALSEIASLLDKLGYTPHPANPSLEAAIRRNEDRRLLLQLGVAAICFANTMVIAVSLYQGLFTGIDATIAHFFRWVSLVLTLPAILYSGQSFFRSSWGALCMRRLHIDLPISLGIIIGFSASVWNTIVGLSLIHI